MAGATWKPWWDKPVKKNARTSTENKTQWTFHWKWYGYAVFDSASAGVMPHTLKLQIEDCWVNSKLSSVSSSDAEQHESSRRQANYWDSRQRLMGITTPGCTKSMERKKFTPKFNSNYLIIILELLYFICYFTTFCNIYRTIMIERFVKVIWMIQQKIFIS